MRAESNQKIVIMEGELCRFPDKEGVGVLQRLISHSQARKEIIIANNFDKDKTPEMRELVGSVVNLGSGPCAGLSPARNMR